MKNINFKKLMIVFVFIIGLINTNSCLATITMKHLYVFPSKSLETLSDRINTHISSKDYYMYKANNQSGFYYIQPKYLGTYVEGNYMIIDLKQVNNDVYCYIQNNYTSEREKQILLEYLNKNKYRYLESKDKELIKKFSKESSVLLNQPSQSDFHFIENLKSN